MTTELTANEVATCEKIGLSPSLALQWKREKERGRDPSQPASRLAANDDAPLELEPASFSPDLSAEDIKRQDRLANIAQNHAVNAEHCKHQLATSGDDTPLQRGGAELSFADPSDPQVQRDEQYTQRARQAAINSERRRAGRTV